MPLPYEIVEINPILFKALDWVVKGLLAILLFVVTRIVITWLTNIGKPVPVSTCALHNGVCSQVGELKDELTVLRTRYVDKEDFRETTTEIRRHIEKLGDNVNEGFADMTQKIASLKTEIGEIKIDMAGIKKNR